MAGKAAMNRLPPSYTSCETRPIGEENSARRFNAGFFIAEFDFLALCDILFAKGVV